MTAAPPTSANTLSESNFSTPTSKIISFYSPKASGGSKFAELTPGGVIQDQNPTISDQITSRQEIYFNQTQRQRQEIFKKLFSGVDSLDRECLLCGSRVGELMRKIEALNSKLQQGSDLQASSSSSSSSSSNASPAFQNYSKSLKIE